MHSDTDLWRALSLVRDLGNGRIKRLFDHFASPSKIFEADIRELSTVDGIGEYLAKKIVELRGSALSCLPSIAPNIQTLCLSDADYPTLLKNIYDPPPVLYYKGLILDEDARAIAVVGTRMASQYGKEMAVDIVRGLVSYGITIISGLALGIDASAHAASLNFGGRTIAVLGSGIQRIYPGSNVSLAKDIIDKGGAIVSEYYPDVQVDKWTFPRRNRIISGLSLGTLVIEGAEDSGSLITARCALDQNREVFAVPGQAGSPHSAGPNSLIKQGAKLVESAEDVLEELNIAFDKPSAAGKKIDLSSMSADEQKIIKLIMAEPKHIDRLFVESGISHSQIYPLLTNLQLKGTITELPGKIFKAA